MKIGLIIAAILCMASQVFAQEEERGPKGPAKKVIYTYKKYEKLDFDDLVIEGDSNDYAELSITPMKDMSVRNKLPYRKNFNEQIKKGISRVR